MKTRHILALLCTLTIHVFYGLKSQEIASDFPRLTSTYLGQKTPGREPELFAEGIVNTPIGMHGNIVFSPDGKYLFFISIRDNVLNGAFWVDAKIIQELKPEGLKK